VGKGCAVRVVGQRATCFSMYRASRESEIGALCILLWNSRFSTTLLKPLSVRRARNE